eukprot:443484-Pelagomonas_calceolata.AAC.1
MHPSSELLNWRHPSEDAPHASLGICELLCPAVTLHKLGLWSPFTSAAGLQSSVPVLQHVSFSYATEMKAPQRQRGVNNWDWEDS